MKLPNNILLLDSTNHLLNGSLRSIFPIKIAKKNIFFYKPNKNLFLERDSILFV